MSFRSSNFVLLCLFFSFSLSCVSSCLLRPRFLSSPRTQHMRHVLRDQPHHCSRNSFSLRSPSRQARFLPAIPSNSRCPPLPLPSHRRRHQPITPRPFARAIVRRCSVDRRPIRCAHCVHNVLCKPPLTGRPARWPAGRGEHDAGERAAGQGDAQGDRAGMQQRECSRGDTPAAAD